MVGGGAYVLGKRSAQRAPAESDQDAPVDGAPVEQQPAAATGTGITDDVVEQLEKLDRLKNEQVLTADEFDAQKKKVLEST
jgi:hypothetical protein